MKDVSSYIQSLKPSHAVICCKLQKEIVIGLPRSEGRLYHGSPAWFVGENAVVGFSVTSQGQVNLLFWNGRAIRDQRLERVGKFEAVRIRYSEASKIDLTALRRWLRVTGREIWDFTGMRRNASAAPAKKTRINESHQSLRSRK